MRLLLLNARRDTIFSNDGGRYCGGLRKIGDTRCGGGTWVYGRKTGGHKAFWLWGGGIVGPSEGYL